MMAKKQCDKIVRRKDANGVKASARKNIWAFLTNDDLETNDYEGAARDRRWYPRMQARARLDVVWMALCVSMRVPK